jgi:hypothetical protein
MAATYIAPLNHVPLLCSHPGESVGAGRVGLAGANIQSFIFLQALCFVKITLYIGIFKIHTMKKL